MKDKMDSLSLNSSKANLVKSVVPITNTNLKVKVRRARSRTILSSKISSVIKFRNQRACDMFVVSRDTRHTSVHFARGGLNQAESL